MISIGRFTQSSRRRHSYTFRIVAAWSVLKIPWVFPWGSCYESTRAILSIPPGLKLATKVNKSPAMQAYVHGVICPGSSPQDCHLQACAKVCRHDYEKIRNYHNLCIRFDLCEICHMYRALKCGNFSENVCPHLALYHLIIFQSLMANISDYKS